MTDRKPPRAPRFVPKSAVKKLAVGAGINRVSEKAVLVIQTDAKDFLRKLVSKATELVHLAGRATLLERDVKYALKECNLQLVVSNSSRGAPLRFAKVNRLVHKYGLKRVSEKAVRLLQAVLENRIQKIMEIGHEAMTSRLARPNPKLRAVKGGRQILTRMRTKRDGTQVEVELPGPVNSIGRMNFREVEALAAINILNGVGCVC